MSASLGSYLETLGEESASKLTDGVLNPVFCSCRTEVSLTRSLFIFKLKMNKGNLNQNGVEKLLEGGLSGAYNSLQLADPSRKMIKSLQGLLSLFPMMSQWISNSLL